MPSLRSAPHSWRTSELRYYILSKQFLYQVYMIEHLLKLLDVPDYGFTPSETEHKLKKYKRAPLKIFLMRVKWSRKRPLLQLIHTPEKKFSMCVLIPKKNIPALYEKDKSDKAKKKFKEVWSIIINIPSKYSRRNPDTGPDDLNNFNSNVVKPF